ncbi:hypothetical protein GCM10023191_023240 [Actinoallomurus oryzae]|uniref:Uncharacterized protein n=1 Tax=Actinoallomurus oryzae TaxID=502180 RepID=A0ABP8PQH4_9ACTN
MAVQSDEFADEGGVLPPCIGERGVNGVTGRWVQQPGSAALRVVGFNPRAEPYQTRCSRPQHVVPAGRRVIDGRGQRGPKRFL